MGVLKQLIQNRETAFISIINQSQFIIYIFSRHQIQSFYKRSLLGCMCFRRHLNFSLLQLLIQNYVNCKQLVLYQFQQEWQQFYNIVFFVRVYLQFSTVVQSVCEYVHFWGNYMWLHYQSCIQLGLINYFIGCLEDVCCDKNCARPFVCKCMVSCKNSVQVLKKKKKKKKIGKAQV
eukprot:TRINITY_DN22809_c0_g1_i2.p2 TRINITY_DN22809_c0_g1~~TRINITY_DN22809_c0_g1_i2.p2  ORF type:complete len:176 (-),score=0.16 TRINITY_DN22809_c0_g1_i2:9-536(-)